MKVFRAYFKVLRSCYTTILLYTGIFLAITLIYKANYKPAVIEDYKDYRPNVAIINNNENSKLTQSFIKYIEDKTNIIDIENDERTISDALFYREVIAVITIPENFNIDFMKLSDVKIKIDGVPTGSDISYINMLINRYLNLANIYAMGEINEDDIIENIEKDLSKEVTVSLKSTDENNDLMMGVYFNYLNYVFLAMFIIVIGITTASFNEENINKRMLCSPISKAKMNMELILGNIVLTIMIWLIYVIASFFVYENNILNLSGLLFIINSFVFAIVSLCIGFLVGRTIKNPEAQSAIANVVSLGTSFTCGAFVPQAMLSSGVLMFTQFLPSYWFIKANDLLSSTNQVSLILGEYLLCIGIEVLFIGLLIFTIIVMNKRIKN